MELDTIFSKKSCLRDKVIYLLCIGTALFHVWVNTFAVFSDFWRNSLHMGLLGAIGFLMYPGKNKHSVLSLWSSVILAALIFSSSIYLMVMEEALFKRNQEMIWSDLLFAAVAILLCLEICRRTTGIIIPVLASLALGYVLFLGRWLPGIFHFKGLGLDTVLYRMYFTDEGLFGMTTTISSTFVFMFVLFAAFLLKSGAGEFIINVSQALTRRLTGGPGLVAVVSSGLMGTISGSAVANTVSTGSITIPMMKKAGFKPTFAAGVETAASTGGQLMPPIMGAGAFIMAEWTQLPYTTIIAVAFLPAVMYFCSVGFYVYLEAKKTGISYEAEDVVSIKELVWEGFPFLFPIAVLMGMLIYGFTPTYSAGYGILAVIVASFVDKIRRFHFKKTLVVLGKEILDSLAGGTKNMIVTGLLLVTTGIIIGCINMTGVSIQFSQMIVSWSGGQLLLALTLITGASLLLGMGLPVTAAYIMLAILAAPALENMLLMCQPVVTVLLQPEHIQELLKNSEFLSQVMMDAPDLAQKALMATQDPSLIGELLDKPAFVKAVITFSPQVAALKTGMLLTAHMIIYWVSQDSNVTPPVCLAAFAGAAIAKSPPMATGFQAWKLAKGLYIVPLLFAYTPLIYGGIIAKLQVFGFGLVGLFLFASAATGYLAKKLSFFKRVLLFCLAIAFFIPTFWLQCIVLLAFAIFYYTESVTVGTSSHMD